MYNEDETNSINRPLNRNTLYTLRFVNDHIQYDKMRGVPHPSEQMIGEERLPQNSAPDTKQKEETSARQEPGD